MIRPRPTKPVRPFSADAHSEPVARPDAVAADARALRSRKDASSPAALAIRHLGIRLLVTLLLAGVIQLFISR